METGACDVCFTLTDTVKHRPGLLYDSFFRLESFLAVPAERRYDLTASYRLKDFEHEVFLLSEDAPELNDMLMETCRQAGFEPRTMTASDFETKMLWVELGLGVAAHGKGHYTFQSPSVNYLKVEGLRDMEHALVWQKENYNPAIALLYSIFS